jgi:hypothetical protein
VIAVSAPRPPELPPSETYLLAADHSGRQIVSVHVKRTYKLRPDGRCAREEQQGPLLMPPPPDPELPGAFSETDVVPFKRATDLIVMAHAWGRGATQVTARIRVGALDVQFRVSGDRRVSYRGKGSWAFGAPEPFESIGMQYERAYGGFDDTVPDPEVVHVIDMFDMHPGEYPRNPVGRGYVVFENRQRIDGLLLPNLEHPQMPLVPERLVLGDPRAWWKQPLPWSCEWFDKLWYPRIVHYRGVPGGLPDDDSVVPEVRMGWLDPGHARKVATATFDDPYDSRLGDAASPALVLPLLRGDEAIELTAMTPDGRLVVQLPADRPRVRIRCDGEVHEVPVVPHRILVSTIEMGVYVVWHAAWPPPHPLPRRLARPGDTSAMLLEGVEAFVDDHRIVPLGEQPT